MARIRTTKPEFWTSEQVVECPPLARLLFIGIWNFCDDAGIHPASFKRLKMEVFPGDDLSISDVEGLVADLIDNGLLIAYEHDGKHYWAVTGWHQHQKIDRPTYKYPQPNGETSPIIRRAIADQSQRQQPNLDEASPPEGKGMEGNGKDIPLVVGTAPPTCPHQEIIELYHQILPMLPRVKIWSKARRAHLKARWSEDRERQQLQWWESYFTYVAKSKFLTGNAPGRNGSPPWMANLEFLVKQSSFTKTVEGSYHGGESE
ncbi:MAG: hypothetical protein RQ936_06115 [Gammaproteobacteria bacterium]|nr:hypothetical protein [Gammaproteobacteria bacterium]